MNLQAPEEEEHAREIEVSGAAGGGPTVWPSLPSAGRPPPRYTARTARVRMRALTVFISLAVSTFVLPALAAGSDSANAARDARDVFNHFAQRAEEVRGSQVERREGLNGRGKQELRSRARCLLTHRSPHLRDLRWQSDGQADEAAREALCLGNIHHSGRLSHQRASSRRRQHRLEEQ